MIKTNTENITVDDDGSISSISDLDVKAILEESTLSEFKNLDAVITIPDLLTPGIIAST